MRRHRHHEEVVAARLPHQDLPLGLGLRVLLDVALLGELRHLVHGLSVEVRSVEAGGGRRRVDHLLHAELAASIDHVPRSADIHPLVELHRVEGAYRSCVVPDAIGSLDGLLDNGGVTQVADDVLDLVVQHVLRRRHDVEDYHLLGTSLDKHLDEPLPDESRAACNGALLGSLPMLPGLVLRAHALLQRRQLVRGEGCALPEVGTHVGQTTLSSTPRRAIGRRHAPRAT
mmetsp:Transcript_47606/g.134081  ORF Transcript_47606/g.134081 Transcript_47606/m.134081 type:complete len:229 (+) Transcript_47606:715-1401(+)